MYELLGKSQKNGIGRQQSRRHGRQAVWSRLQLFGCLGALITDYRVLCLVQVDFSSFIGVLNCVVSGECRVRDQAPDLRLFHRSLHLDQCL